MPDENDDIFNIEHSLPSTAHAAAVASRTPSGPPKVEASKYMPSYGGMFELPGTKLKNNRLQSGLPFFPNPKYVWITNEGHHQTKPNEQTGANCLLATSYLKVDSISQRFKVGQSFSLIRASGSMLNLDIVASIPCDRNPPNCIKSKTYAQVPYVYTIRGLKYCGPTDNYVIVRFREGIKLIQLDASYQIPCELSPLEDDRISIKFVGSFPGVRSVSTVDACLSRNQNTLNIASCDNENIYVKIYDIARPGHCLCTMSRDREEEVRICSDRAKELTADRKTTLRSFVPAAPVLEQVDQINSNPGHLIQSVLTTSNKVSQIDPRVGKIAEHYADRLKLRTMSPTERFKQVEFSPNNDYQLYLMSSEKVRVLDRRFRSKELNIMDHMLDSSDLNMLNMKLVRLPLSKIETLCLSSYGRLCFISFDQTCHTHSLITSAGPLVNPMSMHQPLHEPSPIEITGDPNNELYGLDVSTGNVFSSTDTQFSVFQLSFGGRVCVRGFPRARGRWSQILETRSGMQLENFTSLSPNKGESNPDIEALELESQDDEEPCEHEDEYFDMLDEESIIVAEEKLSSKRARSKYDSMKRMLQPE